MVIIGLILFARCIYMSNNSHSADHEPRRPYLYVDIDIAFCDVILDCGGPAMQRQASPDVSDVASCPVVSVICVILYSGTYGQAYLLYERANATLDASDVPLRSAVDLRSPLFHTNKVQSL